VAKRVEIRLKGQALQALLDATPVDLPKALVDMESQQLAERAAADLQARGVTPAQVPFTPATFEKRQSARCARPRARELARAESLQPKPAEVRALVEQGGGELRESRRGSKMVLTCSHSAPSGNGGSCPWKPTWSNGSCPKRRSSTSRSLRRTDGERDMNWHKAGDDEQGLGLIPMVIEQSGAASAPTTSTRGC